MEERLSWTGWMRADGGDWQRACIAPSWSEAWRALLACLAEAALPEAPVSCSRALEALVNDGRHPDHRRHARWPARV